MNANRDRIQRHVLIKHQARTIILVLISGGIEGRAALCGECGRPAVVHGVGRHECNPRMTMLGVVPTKKCLAVCPRVLNRAEARRKVWAVFQGFELSLGIRIVIRYVRPAVSLGDVEIDEQLRGPSSSNVA